MPTRALVWGASVRLPALMSWGCGWPMSWPRPTAPGIRPFGDKRDRALIAVGSAGATLVEAADVAVSDLDTAGTRLRRRVAKGSAPGAALVGFAAAWLITGRRACHSPTKAL